MLVGEYSGEYSGFQIRERTLKEKHVNLIKKIIIRFHKHIRHKKFFVFNTA